MSKEQYAEVYPGDEEKLCGRKWKEFNDYSGQIHKYATRLVNHHSGACPLDDFMLKRIIIQLKCNLISWKATPEHGDWLATKWSVKDSPEFYNILQPPEQKDKNEMVETI